MSGLQDRRVHVSIAASVHESITVHEYEKRQGTTLVVP
jgi:hypothetical protein